MTGTLACYAVRAAGTDELIIVGGLVFVVVVVVVCAAVVLVRQRRRHEQLGKELLQLAQAQEGVRSRRPTSSDADTHGSKAT